jgi:hypothetical protein
MKNLLIPSLFLLMLPFASMGQSKSNEKSSTFTTLSGETVTINTNATVTQETNGTYDVYVNRSINASGTTSAAGNINTTLVANPDGLNATANTSYVGSQGAYGTITSTAQPSMITTTVSGSEVSGSTIRAPGMVNKTYNTSEGTVYVQKGGGEINITTPSGFLSMQTSGNGSENTFADSCSSGICTYYSSTKSVDNGVVTTTYSGGDGGSATMTYSGTNNGSSGNSTRTITTSSGETVTIESSAAGDDINKSISASGATSGALNVNTTFNSGTATATYISSSGVDETVTRGSTTNTGTSTSTSTSTSN